MPARTVDTLCEHAMAAPSASSLSAISVGAVILTVAVGAAPSTAHAQTLQGDPQARPRMLTEGARITDVVDASYSTTDVDPFWSFRFSLGFVRSLRRTLIQRERSVLTAEDPSMVAPNGVTEFDNVGHYTQITNTLNVGMEIAIYRDLSLHFGLPLILSDSREITAHADNTPERTARILSDGYSRDVPAADGTTAMMNVPTQLFGLPFRSPERSGIDQIRLGASWNILNQARDPHLPTWLLRIEWRPPVGPQLRPCQQGMSGLRCPRLDAPRPTMTRPEGSTNTVETPDAPYERAAGPAEPGISRRVHGLYAQTVMSRRVGYVEPYIGLDFLYEIPEGGTPFRFTDAPFGQLATYPPIQGSLTAGAEIVPWENRESWQRFAIDLRVRGTYYSQGRDYSVLFDALGSSNSVPLTTPTWAISDQPANDPNRAIWFSGTTGVHSHGQLTAALSVDIMAAKFLRFVFGSSLSYVTPHFITATDACNPNETPRNAAERGGCVADAVPDPQHRPVIDSPGQRFRTTEDFIWDLYVNVALTPRF